MPYIRDMDDAPKAAQLKGWRFTLGKDYYSQWDIRIWRWGLDVCHGGYGRAVPLYKPWQIVPFVWARLKGKNPFKNAPSIGGKP